MHMALFSLKGPGMWEARLRPLEKADVQSMTRADLEMDKLFALGEGHRVISWIWLTEGNLGDGSDEDLIQGTQSTR